MSSAIWFNLDQSKILSSDNGLNLFQLVNVNFPQLNSLPNDKILDCPKLKAFADDKLNVAKITISLYDRAENTVGKRGNAGC